MRSRLRARHVHRESPLADDIGVSKSLLRRFYQGERALPAAKLAPLRVWLKREERAWRAQDAVRALLRPRHINVKHPPVAKAVGVSKTLLNRFFRKKTPFPAEKLEILRTCLLREHDEWRQTQHLRRRAAREQRAPVRAVRSLLQKRWVRGIAAEIARETGATQDQARGFWNGRSFPKDKLEALRAFLEGYVDTQSEVRTLLRQCLAEKLVNGNRIAEYLGIHKGAVSRFRHGSTTFPADRLDRLAEYLYLRVSGEKPADRPRPRPKRRHVAEPSRPAAAGSTPSPIEALEAVLVALATEFARKFILAAFEHGSFADISNARL